MEMAPEDIIRSEQEARGAATVREQLVAALERVTAKLHTLGYGGSDVKQADVALDRAHAELEGEGCWCDNCPICAVAGGHCLCYEHGTEAQRERVGGGTA